MAVYPNAVAAFTAKRDSDPTMLAIADHMNAVQDEVVAIQNTIGANPQGTARSFQDRLARGWFYNVFSSAGRLTETGQFGIIPEDGLHRFTVTWVRANYKRAPVDAFRGYRIYKGYNHDNLIAAKRIADNTAPTTYTRCHAPVVTLADSHHMMVLEEGDRITAEGVVVAGGSIFEPHLIVRRLPG